MSSDFMLLLQQMTVTTAHEMVVSRPTLDRIASGQLRVLMTAIDADIHVGDGIMLSAVGLEPTPVTVTHVLAGRSSGLRRGYRALSIEVAR